VIVRKNKVEHAQLSGIAVSATGAGQYRVLANHSRNNTLNGIHFAPATDGGTVTDNTALGNGVDCKDESGPENTWTGNVAVTAQPPVLCTAPTLDDEPGHDGMGHDKKKSKKHKKHHKKTKKQKKHRPDPCACTLPWRF
jgi:hypothetical protein